MVEFTRSISTYIASISVALFFLLFVPTPQYADGHMRSGTHVFVLAQGIYLDWYYYNLINALNDAKQGDKIKIVLKDNPGGLIPTMRGILTAMKNTKATVTTTYQGYASSSAMDILFSGDTIIIPKQFVGTAHLSSTDKGRDFWLIPILSHLEPFMTQQEWQSFTNDGDVPIYGQTVCRVAPHKIEDAAGYCILKGTYR